MPRHLSEPAWSALERAQVEAARRGAARIAPTHLLIALLREPSNRACQALARCGVVLAEVLDGARSAAGTGDARPVPQRSRYDLAMQRAMERAAAMSRGALDTGHLLKAIARDKTSRAAQVLAALGAVGPSIDRAVESIALREPQGPLIDESDAAFDVADSIEEISLVEDEVQEMILDLDDCALVDAEGRLLELRVPLPERRTPFVLLGVCGLLDLALIAGIVATLARYGARNELFPATGARPIEAVPWAGLLSIGVAACTMLLLAGVGLAVVAWRWSPESRQLRRRVPRLLAIGIVGALVGGAPGFLSAYRALDRIDNIGLPVVHVDALEFLPVFVIGLQIFAWVVFTRRLRTRIPAGAVA